MCYYKKPLRWIKVSENYSQETIISCNLSDLFLSSITEVTVRIKQRCWIQLCKKISSNVLDVNPHFISSHFPTPSMSHGNVNRPQSTVPPMLVTPNHIQILKKEQHKTCPDLPFSHRQVLILRDIYFEVLPFLTNKGKITEDQFSH